MTSNDSERERVSSSFRLLALMNTYFCSFLMLFSCSTAHNSTTTTNMLTCNAAFYISAKTRQVFFASQIDDGGDTTWQSSSLEESKIWWSGDQPLYYILLCCPAAFAVLDNEQDKLVRNEHFIARNIKTCCVYIHTQL